MIYQFRNKLRDYFELLFEHNFFFMHFGGVGKEGGGKFAVPDNLLPVLKKLVVGKYEPVLDFFFGKVGGAASFFAFEFVVALPYDTAVLITV